MNTTIRRLLPAAAITVALGASALLATAPAAHAAPATRQHAAPARVLGGVQIRHIRVDGCYVSAGQKGHSGANKLWMYADRHIKDGTRCHIGVKAVIRCTSANPGGGPQIFAGDHYMTQVWIFHNIHGGGYHRKRNSEIAYRGWDCGQVVRTGYWVRWTTDNGRVPHRAYVSIWHLKGYGRPAAALTSMTRPDTRKSRCHTHCLTIHVRTSTVTAGGALCGCRAYWHMAFYENNGHYWSRSGIECLYTQPGGYHFRWFAGPWRRDVWRTIVRPNGTVVKRVSSTAWCHGVGRAVNGVLVVKYFSLKHHRWEFIKRYTTFASPEIPAARPAAGAPA